MKKWLVLFCAVLCMILSAAASAETAQDMVSRCTLKSNNSRYRFTKLMDGKYSTYWQTTEVVNPFLAITAPKKEKICGLYLCLTDMPSAYEIQVKQKGKWVKYADGNTDFHHWYCELPGVDEARIYVTGKGKYNLCLTELKVLGAGDVPADIQRWQPTVEKADLLFVVAHPDDDLIFMGGAIPTYAVERGNQVAVAYLTYSSNMRRHELLNALWSMGVRNYPIIGSFTDRYRKEVKDAYKTCGGASVVNSWLVSMFRQYQPEVIVTHDPKGEYGHGQHKMLADACETAFDQCNDETADRASYKKYGARQPKKLYEHLNGGSSDARIRLDWSVPLASLGGITGFQAAERAFTYHVSQQGTKYDVTNSGVKYSNEVFCLVRSRVGKDTAKNDFLENITELGGPRVTPTPTPTPTPVPSPTPVPEADTAAEEEPAVQSGPVVVEHTTAGGIEFPANYPELNSKGFLDEGEYIYADEKAGLYLYVGQTLRVVIERRFDKKKTVTRFEAEIWTDVAAGELPKNLVWNPDKLFSDRVNASKTAAKYKTVFATNADYYTYRRGSGNGRPMGVEIRDGDVLFDSRYDRETTFFPNLDTVAFYPDGSINVHSSVEMSAAEYLRNNAYLVYSFGPYLIRDGEMSDRALNARDSKQPRYGFGMVEPGHHVAILCEGRLKRSKGVNLTELAEYLLDKGCTEAINLDGGQTAVMVFMGQQLNLIGKYDGKTAPRSTNEILGFGYSEKVGEIDIPITKK